VSEKIGYAPTGRPDDPAARVTHWRGAAPASSAADNAVVNIPEHIKGPWSFYTTPQPNGCPIVGDTESGLMICQVAHSINEPGQAEIALAHARLIAAAPELLEACKSLLTLTQLMANEAYNDEAIVEFEIFSEITKSTRMIVLVYELAKARAAIAKATGRADSGQAAQGDRHE